jgi:hypothetical protein
VGKGFGGNEGVRMEGEKGGKEGRKEEVSRRARGGRRGGVGLVF